MSKYCFRCNTKLEEEKELDYPYYCPTCDENMYSFEALNEKQSQEYRVHTRNKRTNMKVER